MKIFCPISRPKTSVAIELIRLRIEVAGQPKGMAHLNRMIRT